MSLSEYKFDSSRLMVVKRTPKRKKALVGGIEKSMLEGVEEITLWDVSGSYVARVGMETLAVIAGMVLVGQLSPEVMEKEIAHLK